MSSRSTPRPTPRPAGQPLLLPAGWVLVVEDEASVLEPEEAAPWLCCPLALAPLASLPVPVAPVFPLFPLEGAPELPLPAGLPATSSPYTPTVTVAGAETLALNWLSPP